ncbi:MAG TPA: hypothetical protein VK681_09080 [Reyranella sp.]|nr:hypothetical protein [Reyranella sp.]
MKPGASLLSLADQQTALQDSVDRAKSFLLGQAKTRAPHRSSSLVPADPAVGRKSTGTWTGTYTLPTARSALPYTPILIKGPLYFPIVAGRPVTFCGSVDAPFISMYGAVGVRLLEDSERPGQSVPDPGSLFADGGKNWGSFFVAGSVGGVTQFIARVQGNATFATSMAAPPAGKWSFQLISYATATDALADTNRILIGHPWLEAERPGDVREYDLTAYTQAKPLFTDVTLRVAGEDSLIAGTLAAFIAEPAYTYRILVTSEADVEYAWALEEAAAGPFIIRRPRAFGGKIKLRLVEQEKGGARRVVGQAWAEENAAIASAWPDLRIEYRSITAAVPSFPTSIVPASKDGAWAVTLRPPGIGRVALVDVNTRRIYGECTMPSGLLRSYNVPAADAGQMPGDVYYDAFNDACFLYDQAVALIAFLQLGERAAAAALVDALLAVQNPDGGFPFANDQSVLFEHGSGFIRIGAVAWVCYALLLADKPEFRDWFASKTTDAARNCLAFLSTYRNPRGLLNGGKGRYVGIVLDPGHVVPWWSTEHNIDAWWCFDLAAGLYGDAGYRAAADSIKAVLETDGWSEAKGIFWQGGLYAAGRNTPDGQHALDMMSWGGFVLDRWGRSQATATAIARMSRLYYVTDAPTGLSGFTTFIPEDGYPVGTVRSPWYEGSFGAVVAMRIQDPARANALMATLVQAQNADGSYPYALRADPINDIHTFPALIGAAWNVIAYSGPQTPYRRVLWA